MKVFYTYMSNLVFYIMKNIEYCLPLNADRHQWHYGHIKGQHQYVSVYFTCSLSQQPSSIYHKLKSGKEFSQNFCSLHIVTVLIRIKWNNNIGRFYMAFTAKWCCVGKEASNYGVTSKQNTIGYDVLNFLPFWYVSLLHCCHDIDLSKFKSLDVGNKVMLQWNLCQNRGVS